MNVNARTENGKRAFVYSATKACNTLQEKFKLNKCIPLNAFRTKMKKSEAAS
jgi:hypothetical protein